MPEYAHESHDFFPGRARAGVGDADRSTPPTRIVRLDAARVIDADAPHGRGASILLRIDHPEPLDPRWVPARPAPVRGGLTVLAVGAAASFVRDGMPRPDQVISLQDAVVIPGLVNAHAHLDLTGVGPRPLDGGGFDAWLAMIREARPVEPAEIRRAVHEGVRLLLAGGVVAVGDIGGAPAGRPTLEAWRALRDSPMGGVGFIEFFAIGRGRRAGSAALEACLDEAASEAVPGGIRLGIQPHAPYSVEIDAYRRALTLARDRGLALATHLAETVEEREFVARCAGPGRAFLERLGLWDDEAGAGFGRGASPVEHLAEFLELAREADVPRVVAHVNDADDRAIRTLARTRTPVAYCPRASEYFGAGASLGAHRYREMLRAGVAVCLGTDSIVNLPASTIGPGAGDRARISTFDEMRTLYRRDGTSPGLLLEMATRLGAAAIGLEPGDFVLGPGARPAGLVAIPIDTPRPGDPLVHAMESDTRPRLLFIRNFSC